MDRGNVIDVDRRSLGFGWEHLIILYLYVNYLIVKKIQFNNAKVVKSFYL